MNTNTDPKGTIMPTDTKPDLRFTLRTTRNDKITVFKAHVTYMVSPDADRSGMPNDAGVRNPGPWDSEPLRSLADLVVRAQRNDDDPDSPTFYAWELCYMDVHCADMRHVEAMVKRLRLATKRMDKLAERFGRPTDLADFCGRAADALGMTDATPFGIWHDDVTINGTHYRWTDVDGLRSWLDKIPS